MDKLFWRIFGSFWLLLLALAGATLAINYFSTDQGSRDVRFGPLGPPVLEAIGMPGFNHSGLPPIAPFGFPPGPPPFMSHNHPDNSPLLFDVENTLKNRGINGVREYLSNVRRPLGAAFFLFDFNGRLVCGSRPTRAVVNLALLTLQTRHPQMGFDQSTMIHGSIITASNRKLFALIDTIAPSPINWSTIVLRVLALLMAATLICWCLTSQITKPVKVLRSATRDVAAGKFSTRTSPKLNGRRDELGMLGQDFDTMAGKLERLIDAQVRLMADISHELRSPLARLSLASAIARRNCDDETSRSLDRVDLETQRLSELIGQLTSLSQLELGSAHRPYEIVDFKELIDSVVESSEFEAGEKDCIIQTSWNVAATISIEGDRELLRRIIENILRNAVRHTEKGSRIGVFIELFDQPSKVKVTVSDHGSGVPENDLDNIFEPFYRTSQSRDRQSGGVGLGLTIAKRAAAQHGGILSAANRDDGSKGLLVTLILPILPIVSRAIQPHQHACAANGKH
jgi:signal transduction histidine kinase